MQEIVPVLEKSAQIRASPFDHCRDGIAARAIGVLVCQTDWGAGLKVVAVKHLLVLVTERKLCWKTLLF